MSQEWYKRREDIVARRLYWKPTLDTIAAQVRAYLESFPPDPATGNSVFVATYENTDSHPGGVISVTAMTQKRLTIGLPAEALDLIVQPTPSLVKDTGGIVSGLTPGLPADRMQLAFVVDNKTTHPLPLRQILDEFVKHALSL